MKDQLTATLFALVVVGTAIVAGSQPSSHAPRGAAAQASTERSEALGPAADRDSWEHRRLEYGGA